METEDPHTPRIQKECQNFLMSTSMQPSISSFFGGGLLQPDDYKPNDPRSKAGLMVLRLMISSHSASFLDQASWSTLIFSTDNFLADKISKDAPESVNVQLAGWSANQHGYLGLIISCIKPWDEKSYSELHLPQI